ncbi:hypothetical protein ACNKHK_02030 [Shigella flexneri]
MMFDPWHFRCPFAKQSKDELPITLWREGEEPAAHYAAYEHDNDEMSLPMRKQRHQPRRA